MLTPAFILAILALLFAVLSIPWPNYPLLAVSVILLSIVAILSARGG
jgi:hypothetical protein